LAVAPKCKGKQLRIVHDHHVQIVETHSSKISERDFMGKRGTRRRQHYLLSLQSVVDMLLKAKNVPPIISYSVARDATSFISGIRPERISACGVDMIQAQ